jgi:hypothetical protein
MYIISGAAVLLLIIIVLLIVRKKKKGKKVKTKVDDSVKQNASSKYNGIEATDEELESAPQLELVNYVDGVNALVLRFEVKGSTIKLDDIEPYENDWGYVHNYSELIGQNRQSGQKLRLFFNRRKRKTADTKEAFDINIIYRDVEGGQWLQPLRYNSIKGVKMKKLEVLGKGN